MIKMQLKSMILVLSGTAGILSPLNLFKWW